MVRDLWDQWCSLLDLLNLMLLSCPLCHLCCLCGRNWVLIVLRLFFVGSSLQLIHWGSLHPPHLVCYCAGAARTNHKSQGTNSPPQKYPPPHNPTMNWKWTSINKGVKILRLCDERRKITYSRKSSDLICTNLMDKKWMLKSYARKKILLFIQKTTVDFISVVSSIYSVFSFWIHLWWYQMLTPSDLRQPALRLPGI